MSMLTKNLLVGAIVGSLALTGAVCAEEDIKHKTIEIKALKGENVNVMVDTNGNAQTIIISEADLADTELLKNKLANLDDESRADVLQALVGLSGNETHEPLKIKHGGTHKVIVVNQGDDQLVEMSGDNNIEIEFNGDERHIIRKHIILEDDSYDIIKDHTDAIAKLIERGEFSQQELDKLQAALDAKR